MVLMSFTGSEANHKRDCSERRASRLLRWRPIGRTLIESFDMYVARVPMSTRLTEVSKDFLSGCGARQTQGGFLRSRPLQSSHIHREAVLTYLDKIDPEAASRARARY